MPTWQSRRHFWYVSSVLLLLLTGFALYKHFYLPPYATPAVAHDTNDEIDEYLYHAQLRQFDAEGHLTKSFSLESWEHSPHTKQGYFTDPALTIYGPTYTWTITAEAGQAPQAHLGQKLDKLQLTDGVQITSTSKNQTAWLLETPYLWFYLNEQRSETDAHVTITQSLLTIRGQGAEADLGQGIIKLKQHVKTTYHPST